MAIRFGSSNLSDTDYNLYNIEKFNGVDYTTTPTLVDDSRAIEISNYIPKGNSLVKRNGASMLFEFVLDDGTKLHIHNLWEHPKGNEEDGTTRHYIYASQKIGNQYKNPKIYLAKNMLDLSHGNLSKWLIEAYKFNNTYDYKNSPLLNEEDMYSQAFYFEGKLFLLCNNEYLVNQDSTFTNVSNYAYVPTVIIGLGDISSTSKVSFNEEINLLCNKCYIELIRYEKTDKKSQFAYNLRQFFPKAVDLTFVSINGIGAILDNDSAEPIDGYIKNDRVYIEGLGYFSLKDKNFEEFVFEPTIKENDTTEKNEDMYIRLEIKFENNDNSEEIVNKMRFGVSYGSYGHRDRLFLSGNPEFPNMDIHSCEANDLANAWRDYAYFGDSSYSMIGTSETAIKGYGFLNNGSMAIFKENKVNTPNFFIRTYDMKQDAEGNYKEMFPVTTSGLSIDVPVNNQIISYGNDLLINIPNGIYKILVGESTATQTYKYNEMSYFIRENLGDNIKNSCHIVFKNKLYVCREDIFGNKRVYVADANRYGFIDGNQVYEWFVLDGLDIEKFYIFKDELYFSNNKGLFKFNNTYIDEWFIQVKDANINGETFSKDVFVNEETNQIILSSGNEKIQEIVNSVDCKDEWETFKKKTKIKVNGYVDVPTDIPVSKTHIDNENVDVFEFLYEQNDNNFFVPSFLTEVIPTISDNNLPNLIYKTDLYRIKSAGYTDVGYKLYCELVTTNQFPKVNNEYITISALAIKHDFWFDIDELYCEKDGAQYPFSKCVLDDDNWYYTGENNEEFEHLGLVGEVFFNNMSLKYKDFPVDFTSLGSVMLREVVIKFVDAISSHWRSKFNALGRLDYLKTIDRTTFVADAIRGGKTEIGYRTTFKKANSNSGFLYKNELGYKHKNATTNQLMVVKENENETHFISKDLNFNNVDFTFFTFSSQPFAQTYTTKKKIKNFSFMQLTFESTEPEDSTIVSVSFRYKYTRNNKGVK